ncbi:DUF4129 domain-containing protein [Terracidiphilus gabretensis]|uniref:DUF4129 domain-containing protein n=1 Tax=Terracidiphilus gabretensis TaxID=1577687 RepID=UPI00071B9820|nr:DUF4129 domain-containing protein [Terracidiphilus gabretensis]
MILLRVCAKTSSAAIAVLVLLSTMGAARCFAVAPQPAQAAAQGRAANASFDGYRKHLEALISLTQKCAKGRNVESCDAQSIEQDEHVRLGSEQRAISYEWLRVLFAHAQEPDKAQQAAGVMGNAQLQNDSSLPKPKTTSQLLEAAQTRLADDLRQAGGQVATVTGHPAEADAMQKVLSEREFRRLKGQSSTDSILEKVNDWINSIFGGISRLTQGAKWLGRALVWGFVLAVGIGLAWALLQLERRWRIRLVPETEAPAPGAASARDWQLWLADAHKAAAAGLWREAIHFLYWAAISRLESKRLWPADRARTPREYLALVAPEDPRKAGLTALTGSFERTWYGGRAAAETDYRQADELTAALIGAGAADGGRAR